MAVTLSDIIVGIDQSGILLGSLLDVSINIPVDGDVLRYDAGNGVWINDIIPNNEYSLTGLNDTTSTPVANGYLRWNTTGDAVVYEETIPSTSVVGLAPIAYSGDYEDIYNRYIHPTFSSGNIAIAETGLTGATVIDTIVVGLSNDTDGHVTAVTSSVSTREMTPADIGALGATDTAADSELLDGNDSAFYTDAGNLVTGILPGVVFDDSSHGNRSGGTLHDVASGISAGFMSAEDKLKIDAIDEGAAVNQNIVAGAGLTGGGSDNEVTINVGGGDGITADANAVRVDATVVRTTGDQTINGIKTFGSDVFINADLTVQGTINSTDTDELRVEDNTIVLNSNVTAGAPYNGLSGIEIARGDSPLAEIKWDEANGAWSISSDESNYYPLLHAGNMGTGSGIDADLLDGEDGAYYLDASNMTNFNDTAHGNRGGGSLHALVNQTTHGFMSSVDKQKLDNVANNANNYVHPVYTARTISENTGNLTGATVVSNITLNVSSDAIGSVTGANAAISTRDLTKTDLGLGSVENYGIATQIEAAAGVANNKYMTPLRVQDAINANATYTAGSGLSLSNYEFSHGNTSSVSDTSNSNSIVIQNMTFDSNGHVQTVGTTNLDDLYERKTVSEANYVKAGGDTMTGALAVDLSSPAVQSLSAEVSGVQTFGVASATELNEDTFSVSTVYDVVTAIMAQNQPGAGIVMTTGGRSNDSGLFQIDGDHHTLALRAPEFPNDVMHQFCTDPTLGSIIGTDLDIKGHTDASGYTITADEFIGKFTDTEGDFVTVSDAQTITGKKTFSTPVVIDFQNTGGLQITTPVGGYGGINYYDGLGNDRVLNYFYDTDGSFGIQARSENDAIGTGFIMDCNFSDLGRITFSKAPRTPAEPVNADDLVNKSYTDTSYLGISDKASDSDKLDGLDSGFFLYGNRSTTGAYRPTDGDTENVSRCYPLEVPSTGSNLPVATQWFWGWHMEHSDGNGYGLTLGRAGSGLHFRNKDAGEYGDWKRAFADDYHPNADKWTTARTITLGGDLSGSVSLDGSSNVTLTSTVANDSHSHSNYVETTGNETIAGTKTFNGVMIGKGTDPASIRVQKANSTSYAGYGWYDHNSALRLIAYMNNTSTGGDTVGFQSRKADGTIMGNSILIDNERGIAQVPTPQLDADIASKGYVDTNFLGIADKAANADLLDGIDSSQFLRSDATDVKTAGTLRMNDYVSLLFGTGSDVEHFWNGTNYYTDINGGGNWYIRDGNTSNATRFTFDVDTGNLTATTFTGALSGNASTASKWASARTITLGGDLSGSVSLDGSSNVTLTGTVANDSHSHAFNNLTNKTSGTGDYRTTGTLMGYHVQAGYGSGGVALTTNDGLGNANITFNHKSGYPEQDGNAFRITANTDSTTSPSMAFQLKAGVSDGVLASLNSVLVLSESAVTAYQEIKAPTFNTTSSIRYKKDVDYSLESLIANFDDLKPVSYTRKDNGKREIGFIAEEMAESYPLVVLYNEDGTPEGLDYSRVTAILAAKVKTQQVQLDDQADKIARLEAQVEKLMQMLDPK